MAGGSAATAVDRTRNAAEEEKWHQFKPGKQKEEAVSRRERRQDRAEPCKVADAEGDDSDEAVQGPSLLVQASQTIGR